MNSCFNRRLNCRDQRLYVSGRFGFSSDCVFGRFDGAATLVAQHDDETNGQMIDRVLDASQAVIVDHVTRHSEHE